MEQALFQNMVTALFSIDFGDKNLYLGIMFVLIGVLANVFKFMLTTKVTFLDYWITRPKRSQMAAISTLGTFLVTYSATPEAPPITYIAIGFALDNLINKAAKPKLTVKQKLPSTDE